MVAVLLVAWQHPAEPDFSGRWRLASAEGSANAASALVVEQTITHQTKRGEPMRPYYSTLRVDRHFADGVRTETQQIGIAGGSVGGVAGEGTDPSRSLTSFSVLWRDRSLVIRRESRVDRDDVTQSFTSYEETWSMDAEGRLVIVAVARASGTAPTSSKLTYARAGR